jgi:formate C-acetyltransferase
MRAAMLFEAMTAAEEPVIFEGEQIVATRTVSKVPSYFTADEWAALKSRHYLHENGMLSNISPNLGDAIAEGLEARKQRFAARMESADAEGRLFLESAVRSIEALQGLIARYEACAREMGDEALAEVLASVRVKGATTFREALQLLRFIHFGLWESGCYHNTLGRFDQYMYPYYKADLDSGRLSQDQAYELLLSFFLACNKDSDLYPGMQQGDNGQSLVLGGRDASGKTLFNDLSARCLEASYDLNLIDPKINLRVDRNTPLEIYKLGARLTKRGLGFPQYDNDDVVVPGLERLGYAPEDANDYVVAACWEFIIPGKAMDIVNIGALSFAGLVSRSVDDLGSFDNFEDYYAHIDAMIKAECRRIAAGFKNLYIAPAPLYSVFMDGTLERARDITLGAKYNNFGIHGTGIATAVDSLAAIRKYVFDEKSVSVKELQAALDANFEGYDDLWKKLRFEAPKMGNDDDGTDALAARLLDSFDNGLAGLRNERGGIFRAGTGTAMYYIFHAIDLKATPDGRKAGEVIPANYSPSMYTRHKGPVSVIKSFSKGDLSRSINGGPLTIELDDTLFRNEENLEKLAMLIRSYVLLGGHQLQLNTLNKETLLDAKAHPEKHRNLIVRVWGWSGYFVELDECYQDHIIQRIKFTV